MITLNTIMGQLKALVEEQFPGEDVYTELRPNDSTRPSTLIVLDSCDCDVNYSTGGIEMRPVYTLTTFVEVDEYHFSHLDKLHQRQMQLASIFLPGHIKVGDRAPKVAKPLKLSGGYDFDTVTVTLSYALSRKDFMELVQTPLMEHLHISEEVKTYE